MVVANIPVEIIIKILSRLPLEALLRCRSVCKLWLNIIKEPQFVHTHLLAPTRDLVYLIAYGYGGKTLEGFNFHLLRLVTGDGEESERVWKKSENSSKVKEEPDCYCSWGNSMEFIGSCKGLVCFKCERKVYVMNPLFSNDVITVPLVSPDDLRKQTHHSSTHAYLSFSFGFDESSESFKVVCISGCRDLTRGCSREFTSAPLVLDLGMGKSSSSSLKFRWRALSSPSIRHPCVNFRSSPVFIGGAILFLGSRAPLGGEHDVVEILSFDMGKETFKVITLPIPAPHKDWAMLLDLFDLFDFDGRIGLLRHGIDNIIRGWSLVSDGEDNGMNKWVEEFQFKAPSEFYGLKAVGFDKTKCEIIFWISNYFAYNTQTGVTSALPNAPPELNRNKRLLHPGSLLLHQGSLVCASNLTPVGGSS